MEVYSKSRAAFRPSQTTNLFETFRLLESKGNIIRLLKFPEELADRFEQISPQYCFALAKVYDLWVQQHDPKLNDYKTKLGGMEVPKVTQDEWNAMSDEEKEAFKQKVAAAKQKGSTVGGRVETYRASVLSKEENFNSFMDETGGQLTKLFKKNPNLSKKFNNVKSMEEVEQIFQELQKDEPTDGKIVMKFSNGWYWTMLEHVEHSIEAKLMQHCATDGRGQLVSLRDPNNQPHVTMTWNRPKNTIYQIKGKQNKIPEEKYWPFIEQLCKQYHPKIRDSYLNGGRDGGGQGGGAPDARGPRLKDLLIKHQPEIDDRNGVKSALKAAAASTAVKEFMWPATVESFIPNAGRMDWEERREMQEELSQVMQELGFRTVEISHSKASGKFFYTPELWNKPHGAPPPASQREHWYTFCAALLWRKLSSESNQPKGAGPSGIGNPDVLNDPVEFYNRNHVELEQFWTALCKFFGLEPAPLKTVLDSKLGQIKSSYY